MKERVDALKDEIKRFTASNKDQLEEFRLKFISRKSVVADLFSNMKSVLPEDRKEMGKLLNELKHSAQEKFKELISSLDNRKASSSAPVDLTLPPIPDTLGSLHPLSITRKRILEIFERIGFNVSYGPEIEDDWHNFTALNFPENHPAREMQDTFFIERDPDVVLRTHTSSVQVRVMEKGKPPIRTLSPGRVFRNEAISVRAHCIFHQVEGLYIDKNVSFADLKQTLLYFAKEFFGKNTKIRLRPSYFPFTEPSAELDISCFICGQKGCKICKHTGWVEIGGCGMVDPNVLENCNIDPDEYTGFAFGMGIERITMLKYQINDIRLFTENDIRFLRQFKSVN
ncbi:MAG: phenylalanine--tRNA ligase subunit alpha [Cytophagales bacterium]|nr:phenylalanine--tRNA ligase subunit alpha [Cytophagales bacterium]